MVEILLFEANSVNDSLAISNEIRTIEESLRAVSSSPEWHVKPVMAVRPQDWRLKLNTHKSAIVHFSGHGSESGALHMLDERNMAKPVSPEALKSLFRIFKKDIHLVVLNACNSSELAQAISEDIDCTIGMNGQIYDGTATAFVSAFYQGLKLGNSVKSAFEQAQNELKMRGLKGAEMPMLFVRPGVDPSQVWLVEPQLRKETNGPLSVFYVYVPEDKELCLELDKQLVILRRQKLITGYQDQDLAGGVDSDIVLQRLHAAQIILLMVSPALMHSDLYIKQLEPSWEMRAKGTRVIPIMLKPVLGWEEMDFGKLVWLPKGGRAISEWRRRDEALFAVATGIREVVNKIRGYT